MAEVRVAAIHQHDGEADFPHGAGPSDPGWYVYVGNCRDEDNHPNGPFATWDEAFAEAARMLAEEEG